MKITKTELMEMIREALREELSRAKRPLKEAAPTTTSAIINRYNNNVADHIRELEHEKAFNDAEWFEDEWYALENVEVYSDYFVLVMDRPIESIQDAEAIISYAFNPANIVNIKKAMSEGGVVQDETSNEIYVERWVVEQDRTIVEASQYATQAEHEFKKGFISFLIKNSPRFKDECAQLNKILDFRDGGQQSSFDISTGVVLLPQTVIKNKDYMHCLRILISEIKHFVRLATAAEKMRKIQFALEDAYLNGAQAEDEAEDK